MTRYWARRFLPLVMLLLLCTRTVTAQEGNQLSTTNAQSQPPSAGTTTLPEMVVSDTPEKPDTGYVATRATSATKTDTPIMQTPASIQVVPREVLEDQQIYRLEDAVKNVSGVQQIWNSGGQYEDFIVRGFGTNYARFRNGVRLPPLTFSLANVERIEVLKGPAAMLYGRLEPGGIVNVVTAKPQPVPAYSLQQQFGSYRLFRTTASITGPLTQDQSLLYRLDVSYLDKGSFRDFVDKQQVFLAPSVTWRPTQATEVNLTFEYLNEDPFYDNGIPAIGKHVVKVPISRSYNQKGFGDHIEGPLLDFNWSHRLTPNWTIRNGLVANWINYEFRQVPVAYFQPRLENTPTPQVRRGIYFENFSRDTYTTYIDLVGTFSTGNLKHSVLVGGDYYYSTHKNHGFFGLNALFDPLKPVDYFTFVDVFRPVYPDLDFNVFNSLRKGAPNDFGKRETSWFGIYFQDQITLWDRLHILGGGRYDWARSEEGDATTSFAAITRTARNQGHFSPRVGLLYQPWTWLSVYGNYVESFGANNGGRSATGKPLDPETATQYEAGVKTDLWEGRLTSNIAYYYLTKENVQRQVAENAFDTLGEVRSQGIEVDVAGQLTNGLSLIASYAFTDARITKANDGSKGHRVPSVPEHSASLWLKYAFQQAGLQGLSVGAGLYLVDSRKGDIENSYELGGYTRLDMFAAYRMNLGPTRLTAQLNFNNLTDKTYFYTGLPYNNSKAYNLPGEPLNVMGSLRLEY